MPATTTLSFINQFLNYLNQTESGTLRDGSWPASRSAYRMFSLYEYVLPSLVVSQLDFQCWALALMSPLFIWHSILKNKTLRITIGNLYRFIAPVSLVPITSILKKKIKYGFCGGSYCFMSWCFKFLCCWCLMHVIIFLVKFR